MTHAALTVLRQALLGAGLALAVAACESFEPYEYHPSSEIPQGPGILSGDDGEFVIYRE